MKISELRPRQSNIEVEGIIKEVETPRSFNKFGRQLSVANAILEDESGNIKLTLWNDDIRRFKQGDRVKVINGFVNEFQGEAQLTSGKFGRLEKVGENEEGKDEVSGENSGTKSSKKKSKKIDESEENSESSESENEEEIEEVEY